MKLTAALCVCVLVATARPAAAQLPRPPRPARPPRPPAAPTAPAAPAAGLDTSRDGGHQVFSSYADGFRMRVESQGFVELTEDRRDVKSLSPNGYFELTSRGWLSLFGRRYVVRGNPDGTITRQLFVGATKRPLTDAARSWIGDDIARIARQGFAADARIKQVFAQKGASAAFDEISRLDGDFVKARAVMLVLDDPSPATAETVQLALSAASREIGSDVEKARVLLAVMDQQPHTAAVVSAVIASSARISSDFEHARVLLRVADAPDAPADALPALTRAATGIRSDFERGRVLSALAQRQTASR